MQVAYSLFFEGSQEVPQRATSAFGTGLVIYDTVTDTASYVWNISGIDFGPISGQASATGTVEDNATGFHFHNNVRGANAGVVFDIPGDDTDDLQIVRGAGNTWTVSGAWEPSDDPAATPTDFVPGLGSATPGSDVALYANIHTTRFPGGEIRAQWVASADDNSNTVTGTTRGDILNGLGGNDTVNGLGGNDTLSGGSGADRVYGGAGSDRLLGGSGNDALAGHAGTDSLFGEDGNDRLIGGVGKDSLTGGTGSDRFIYNSLSETAAALGNADVIMDWQGADFIAVSASGFGGGLVAGVPLASDQFRVDSAPAGSQGQFLYNTFADALLWDADGDGAGSSVVVASFATNVLLNSGDILVF